MSFVQSQSVRVFALVLFLGITFCPPRASAEDQTKALTNFVVRQNAPSQFVMKGFDNYLGKYTCYGEMDLPSGKGVVVMVAANGDRMVGAVQAVRDRNGDAHMQISWREAVKFSDGNVVVNTGGFVDNPPPQNLVVIAIIAILIGLLLPAVQ